MESHDRVMSAGLINNPPRCFCMCMENFNGMRVLGHDYWHTYGDWSNLGGSHESSCRDSFKCMQMVCIQRVSSLSCFLTRSKSQRYGARMLHSSRQSLSARLHSILYLLNQYLQTYITKDLPRSHAKHTRMSLFYLSEYFHRPNAYNNQCLNPQTVFWSCDDLPNVPTSQKCPRFASRLSTLGLNL